MVSYKMVSSSTITLVPSWGLGRLSDDDYSIPFTHYTYLQYICHHYRKVILIAGVSSQAENNDAYYSTGEFSNLKVVEIPRYNSYLAAVRHFGTYYRAYKDVDDETDIVYCRVPDPFSWMPKLLFHKKCIMHFVGDAIDATKHNEAWSVGKKLLMIMGYLPDYLLTILAAKKSTVYTNGFHLSERLSKFGVKATPVVSSTIRESTLVEPSPMPSIPPIRLIYVGYIRFAKGMHCLLEVCAILKKRGVPYHFDIVGNGEMFNYVKNYIDEENLSDDVTMHGHIDNRDKLNTLLRQSNLFFFPSLSEGSPRVVVEAMAQGLPVLSTPVGAVPFTFKDHETIRLFDFDDAEKACDVIEEYVKNSDSFVTMRDKAYSLVKEKYTIEKFLSQVFTYEK